MQDSEAVVIMKMLNTMNNHLHTIMDDTHVIKSGTKPVEISAASNTKAAYFFISNKKVLAPSIWSFIWQSYPYANSREMPMDSHVGMAKIEKFIEAGKEYNFRFVVIDVYGILIDLFARKQLPNCLVISLARGSSDEAKLSQIKTALAENI